MKFSTKMKAGILAGSAIAGATSGIFSGSPGHRMDYAKEGLLTGAAAGAGIVLSPKLVKWGAGRTKGLMKKGYETSKIVFRRVRGRIIPFRMRAK